MKSAYELAMERLERDNPSSGKQLTEAQKEQLRDVEQRFAAKIAEKEIFLNGQIDKARASRDADAVRQLEAQLASERERLNDEKEQAKETVRRG
jgi:hypothetical protein